MAGGNGNGSHAADKSADGTAGDLIPQPHGGALLKGGKKGNKGGSGPTPSALRALLRGSAAKRIGVLEEVADGIIALREKCPKCGHEPVINSLGELPVLPTPGDRVRALNTLLQHGLHEQTLALSVVQDRILLMAELLRSALPPELYDAIAPRLRAIWNAT